MTSPREPPPAVRRVRLVTADPERAHEHIRETYTAVRAHLLDDPADFAFELSVSDAGGWGLHEVRYSASVEVEAEPPAALVVTQQHHPSRLRVTCGDQEADDELLLAPSVPFSARWSDVTASTVVLDREQVARVGAEVSGLDPGDVAFTALGPLSPERGRYWSACTTHVRRDLLEQDQLMGAPLVRAHAMRHLAIAVLAVFPNTTQVFDPPSGRTAAAPATVRRAIDFVEGHADTDIGLTEIARAARLSPRALQQAFADHHDTTPMGYLRRVRLERAHRDLQVADPTRGDTVAGVAARWGFTHPGRFSIAYRDHYGVSPSHTLQR